MITNMAAQSVRSRLNICRQFCAKCGLFTSCSPLHILRRTPTYATASRINIFSRGMFVCQALGTKIPDSEWKKILTSEQFWVCRQKGTEPPWSGKFVDHKKKGIFQCVCCGADLFSSDTKFDSGTGWPSFYDAIHEDTSGEGQPPVLSVSQKHDDSHGMIRVEVLCKKCDSHLGHVFQDGPAPTGLRYCINSLSLKFQQAQANSDS